MNACDSRSALMRTLDDGKLDEKVEFVVWGLHNHVQLCLVNDDKVR